MGGTRQVRIVAISDQHGYLPDIPPCDMLIVAGDNCPDYPSGARERVGSGPQTARQMQWFKETWLPWRHKQPAEWCLLTWGNHDYCGQALHAREGADVWFDDKTVAMVDDDIELDSGNASGLRVWLTPWSSQFRDWAFMAEEDELEKKYATIPEGIDILVSHQPPKGYGDTMIYELNKGWELLGSVALLNAVQRVKPRVLICGHIHSGFGYGRMPLGDGKVCDVYNVAHVDEQYKPVHQPTVIDL